MKAFGISAIPHPDAARIRVPTALIWGRHDLQARLGVVEAANARYGRPLHVIEDCGVDPNIKQPRRIRGRTAVRDPTNGRDAPEQRLRKLEIRSRTQLPAALSG